MLRSHKVHLRAAPILQAGPHGLRLYTAAWHECRFTLQLLSGDQHLGVQLDEIPLPEKSAPATKQLL